VWRVLERSTSVRRKELLAPLERRNWCSMGNGAHFSLNNHSMKGLGRRTKRRWIFVVKLLGYNFGSCCRVSSPTSKDMPMSLVC